MDNRVRDQINGIIRSAALADSDRHKLLSEVVTDNWGPLPPWAARHPMIEIVQKATAGSGAVFTFEDHDIRKVLLAEAGAHYGPSDGPRYMIPGGFINLTRTEGSSLVAASDKPESPRVAIAREGEEEFKNADGSPLFTIDPARLKPMDMDTLLLPWGERRIVLGAMMELTADEVTAAKRHVERLAIDPAYKDAVARQTINPESGKPEVGSAALFDLDDIVAGKVALFHPDQQSLFRAVAAHFKTIQKLVTAQNMPRRHFWQEPHPLGAGWAGLEP